MKIDALSPATEARRDAVCLTDQFHRLLPTLDANSRSESEYQAAAPHLGDVSMYMSEDTAAATMGSNRVQRLRSEINE